MQTTLLGQRCKIYKQEASTNAIGALIYTKEYINNNNWIKCRFDSLNYRSTEELTPGVRREEIRGVVYLDYKGIVQNNYIIEIDTNGDNEYDFTFEVFSVNPVYGFSSRLSHQEIEVIDVKTEIVC